MNNLYSRITMTIREVVAPIEAFAPLRLQASYDNSGLVVGRMSDPVQGVLLAVDVTDEVLDEAEKMGANLIITHHPIIFHPLKRFNSEGYVQRCVERAIRKGIALYACHTNLDSTPKGMSWRLAHLLGVEPEQILEPSAEEPEAGFGVVGELPESRSMIDYLKWVKERLGVGALRHSALSVEEVKRVAICTGSGASLMTEAQRSGVDLYITADLKYNDFMTPDGAFVVADVGHFESEYCAIDLLFDVLSKKMFTFAVRKSECSCNPVYYLV